MAFGILMFGISLEVVASYFLKQTNGFRNFWPTVIVLVGYLSSLICVTLAMQTVPLGVAYALWAGIGTLATAVLAAWRYHEPLTVPKLWGLSMIVAGAVLLNL